MQELCALQAERRRSFLGELRVAVVLGDAGMGKTRLAAELLPRDDELAVGLTAHSTPLGGMPLLGPWAQALGLRAGALHADGVCRACGSGLGGQLALARRAGVMLDALSCGQALRHHFVEWLPDLLAKTSADRPVVVVDDVHHGDDAVWEMLLPWTPAGPSEAREADLGVSAGNGKGQIFVRGNVIKTVSEHQIVQTLLDEAVQRDWSDPSE